MENGLAIFFCGVVIGSTIINAWLISTYAKEVDFIKAIVIEEIRKRGEVMEDYELAAKAKEILDKIRKRNK